MCKVIAASAALVCFPASPSLEREEYFTGGQESVLDRP